MNHRKIMRFSANVHVKLRDESVTSWGIICDASDKGLFIKSNRDFTIDTELHIEIIMPDNTSSMLRGVVRRKSEVSGLYRKYGLGVEITEKDLSYRNFIDSLSISARAEPGIYGKAPQRA